MTYYVLSGTLNLTKPNHTAIYFGVYILSGHSDLVELVY